MEDNIKSKNIKFNLSSYEDKAIYDYFNEHRENFSKITKKLLLEYIRDEKEQSENKETNEPVIKALEYNTELLEEIKKIINSGIKIEKINEEKINNKDEKNVDEESGFNMGFLDQLRG